MSDAGDTIASIAERVGCTTFTVKHVRILYRTGGIDALRPIKPPARPSRAGIRFSADQMRRLLHQEGYSVHRPKHTMKGKRDEAAYAKAKKQLRRLKKNR
jgi:hypothetical protein